MEHKMKFNWCSNGLRFWLVLLPNLFCLRVNADDSYMNHFREIEFRFEEMESNNSNTPWRDREVSFGYKYEPISEIVRKIMLISGKKVVGLEPLDDMKRLVMMTRFKAIKAVTILLKCEGFKMIEKEKYFQVVEDKIINRNACLY